jgi:hypothetical protein
MPQPPEEDFSLVNVNFSNGIASPMADKDWLPYSARFTRNLAIFDNLNYATLNPIPIKDSGSVVTDLIKKMESTYPYDNARYAYGDSGNVYRITNNTWVLDHTIASGSPAGQGMVLLVNQLLCPTSTTIAVKQPLNNSGVWNDDLFSDGVQNVDINYVASGQTYTVPSSITENQLNTLYFGSGGNGNTALFAYDPIKTISLYVTSVGTGNMTIALHDKYNNALGTATITNGSLVAGAMNAFVFSTPLRIQIGATYHLHITQATADGTIQTGTTNDFSTAQVQSLFGILIADAKYHPGVQATNGVTAIAVIGNEHYLATYDGTTYNPNKITLEPGYSVRKITKINQNIIAYCWKGNDLTAYEEGRAYVWDGIQPYYTIGLPLTLGMPNTTVNFKNRVFGVFGGMGDMSIAPDETTPFRQIQSAPKLTKGYITTVEPEAISVWQKRALVGFSNTTDPNAGVYNDPSAGNHTAGSTYTPPVGLEQGVYEFGNQSDRAITYTAVSTEVLNFAYQPSTAIANPNSFTIGCTAAFGSDLYVSYKDGTSYYVDRINKLNNPVAFGSWESLIDDHSIDKYGQLKQLPQRNKLGVRVRITFVTLPTGCTVTAKYRLNRSLPWIFGQTAVAGSHIATARIGGIASQRYTEIEYGFDVTATVNFPYITSAGLFFKPLAEESISGDTL